MLAEGTKYIGKLSVGSLSEVAEQISKYQTIAFLPKVKSTDGKEGGSLERAIREIKDLGDGRFVIDGLVTEPFKPQFYESDMQPKSYLQDSKVTGDYDDNAPRIASTELELLTYREKKEMTQDAILQTMGVGGSGKYFKPAQREKFDVWSKTHLIEQWIMWDMGFR